MIATTSEITGHRAYAEANGIRWHDVEITRQLVDALIAANTGSDRTRIRSVLQRFPPSRPWDNNRGPNYVRALINAESIGIDLSALSRETVTAVKDELLRG